MELQKIFVGVEIIYSIKYDVYRWIRNHGFFNDFLHDLYSRVINYYVISNVFI
jgi:hypothetical protein